MPHEPNNLISSILQLGCSDTERAAEMGAMEQLRAEAEAAEAKTLKMKVCSARDLSPPGARLLV